MHKYDPSYLESTRQRLLSRTEVTPDCWLWFGAKSYGGYGKIYFVDRVVDTHRVSWMLQNGPIPDGAVIAHRCDVRNCVNPDHLFLTTQAGNLADMRAKARESRGPEHAEAIKAGWTPELRAYRAKQTSSRYAELRTKAARAAGVPLDWKHCAACDTWKPRADFYRNAARRDGLKPKCKPCSNLETRDSRRRKKAL